jgi:hypothetical protein
MSMLHNGIIKNFTFHLNQPGTMPAISKKDGFPEKIRKVFGQNYTSGTLSGASVISYVWHPPSSDNLRKDHTHINAKAAGDSGKQRQQSRASYQDSFCSQHKRIAYFMSATSDASSQNLRRNRTPIHKLSQINISIPY